MTDIDFRKMADESACRDGMGCHPHVCVCAALEEAADEIERLRDALKTCRELGLEEAIRVIEGMNTNWPDAIGRSLGDDYGRQFASRIRDRIELTKRAEREQCARIAESFTKDYPDIAQMARRIAEVIRRQSRATREEMERPNERQD